MHTQRPERTLDARIAGNRGAAKADHAGALGAHHYVDSTAGDVSGALRDLVGVSAEPLPISPMQLISPGLWVVGHPSGTARDVEETMQFAALSGCAPTSRRWRCPTPPKRTRRWTRAERATAWS